MATRDHPDGTSSLYPAGMPLQALGFAAAFSAGIDRLNAVMVGRWDGVGPWEPLPRRVEQLRRAVESERQDSTAVRTDR